MPIYAYRCESCGFDKDVLQKMSDAPLTQCPSCGADTFRKQVTAAGFQLKGSGWYVTDFRGGNGGKSAAATGAKADGENTSSEGSKPAGEAAASASGDSGAAASTASSAASTPGPAAAST
ncbi:FmdB family zinc ribbon protein [Paraburkholderia silvatlantica]|uniref:FmdB family regulatory protein n=1 Tax=Paraburkholderia silvatlantica TaxID=321895 RepID=A0A2U1AFH2_9BURK|nr:FmdB family zinc ribbon protein [Paraburkholderia silvatlantica]MBB2929603.1 putative FmdB family regulatory protein [Paraburkholderia silvatlantica]PVY35097.1 putative FmdB family regulatory protein [Paraburkholderia silvatlantica]PXW39507.1 putative FmdB family regulatory protein [Paraburkholderia silvatlantica]PYE23360.1 putative FmdB family regulatory protein [Paraburkholderia silvatlantica]TDQ78394.1 putative FmdB family regulatory protein [Paraburkholderia silvatlantica]